MNDIPHINGYTIERLIACGGTAEVYRAIQQSSARPVALKILNAQQDDPSFTERFLKEGRLIAALQHPHIITIHDLGIDRGRHYIAMELVEGGDLDRQLQGQQPFHPLRALAVLRDVATCLQFVHERGIIHRDVKPANVLFRQNGSLVLTDFGIAKLVAEDVKLTQTGSAVGSPAYSSPEQSQGLDLDVRTDVYSLGVMFLEMLLGYNPYKAETYANTSINHIQMPVPRLEGALKPYQDLVDRMLAKQPAQRFASMQALLDYLANPPQARWYDGLWGRNSFLAPWGRYWPRSPLAWVGIVSTALLLASGAWFGWDYFQDQRHIRDLLQKAELARAEDRLLSPAGDSAIDYYRQVLALRPDHAEARQGIVALAQHYLELARAARDRQRPEEALRYVNRGLGIDPYSVPLIDLKAELERDLRGQAGGDSRTKPGDSSPGFLERLFH